MALDEAETEVTASALLAVNPAAGEGMEDMDWNDEMMGKWVRITHRLVKTRPDNKVKWARIPASGTAMIIGRRWVKNGRIKNEGDYDEYGGTTYTYTVFCEDETIPCLSVVRNDRVNPIYIPVDGFELID